MTVPCRGVLGRGGLASGENGVASSVFATGLLDASVCALDGRATASNAVKIFERMTAPVPVWECSRQESYSGEALDLPLKKHRSVKKELTD